MRILADLEGVGLDAEVAEADKRFSRRSGQLSVVVPVVMAITGAIIWWNRRGSCAFRGTTKEENTEQDYHVTELLG